MEEYFQCRIDGCQLYVIEQEDTDVEKRCVRNLINKQGSTQVHSELTNQDF